MSKKFQIDHLANLSNLKLRQKEEKKYTSQIVKILEYIESLHNAQTDNRKIIGQIIGLKNVWRKDTVRESLPVKYVLDNAKNTHSNFFKVGAIFENRDN
ncbi:Asp-tRNA(Asn)/Glu-tRNA(Gln) amidotransferase GatCAB subunit C [Candidatus Berkelbacteria bacterium CG_4_9_14_3_um_filter_39_23]|uniref:Asp-tRNA(Asn)/Glu-tRNA(Gln) amidotransferase GatCAB subunit C n=2 Tax=Candidatus Berkelbacteria TaxID=1618330 RepID=A0A2M7CHU6_9BACT|nr:Asp-tRNA(Asn)/Glu-tRNA(Gln) amidotransferase subunit GatC [Candidatus Berkelbacteria bacterium]OIP05891.1 MAG: hypothetical protein AUK14_00810 [Candidatus Berkelbacteria bacterium CG2_30_39_44]PIR27635.1 MAG: Asp-tRNA(Asn)/Glu-tRNA(Gln) amidotransferase GatCAB subunit C [Candidatus Berkelbacteria bacterium CG11_big_fil_rev_8_21_14_0_20_40_23]PIV25222.1 MAG: Asp-tRNA(Asn)/Glu-tRNA(Gln) amidotransferase GatCAB subunit C [Candidatus Berkelbacteria bacterium CG03_land_8_20_14_0_80_40_36]PIX3065